ncbi:MAG: FtsW/RodA/SpoVE family cell cycle protein [Thermomicrobiales bacterium]
MSGVRGRWRDFDLFLLLTTFVMIGFSSVAVWSAAGTGPLTFSNAGVKQAIFGLLGIFLMLLIACIDYRFFASLAWPIYAGGLVLLALVLVPGVGQVIAGSRRWFDFGFTTVQPSEFVKVTTLIALAAFVASRGEAMREPGNFALSLLIVAVPFMLVFEQPDLGTSLVYGIIWASIMALARTHKRYFVLLAIATPFVLIGAWVKLLDEYQHRRFLIFLDPDADQLGEAFNIIQARISIGAGGFFGAGLAGGTQSQQNLLSVRTSDFIFAHASGMFGFIGMLALFSSFVILIWRSLRVVELARDDFGRCIAAAVTGVILFQAFVNIGMNLGLMPVTGITLPFVSSGLSSVWTFLIAQGILQSILMRRRKLGFQPS